jgi:hypothetical protein
MRERIYWQSCVSQVAFSRIFDASILASLESVPDPDTYSI